MEDLTTCEDVAEVVSLQCCEKSILGDPQRRMRSGGKIYTCENRSLSPGSQCLISIPLALKEVQSCLHQAQKLGQCPDILHHWFSPCLCPHPPGLVCSRLVLCSGPRSLPLGSGCCQGHMAAVERTLEQTGQAHAGGWGS